jgi:TPR repeat protein
MIAIGCAISLFILHRILANTPETSQHNMNGVSGNVVYVDEEGHKEAVYDVNGLLVEDLANQGSYNYFSRRTQPLRHFVADTLPWIVWGNAEDDPTTVKERISAFLEDFRYGVSVEFSSNFDNMLKAAKKGDSLARVVVAYSYYLGEYRDGSKVEKDLNKAYAWASLANYQGNKEAEKLVNGLVPKLENRAVADALAGEYFKAYGAERGTK